MYLVLIVISLLLVLLIIWAIIRLYRLTRLLKKPSKTEKTGSKTGISGGNAKLLAGFLVVGFALVIGSILKYSEFFLPSPSSVHGAWIDRLFFWTLLITGSVFVLTHLLLFLFPLIYPSSKSGFAFFFPINYKMEIIWTAIPFTTFISLFIWGTTTYHDIIDKAPDNSLQIEVVGQQFSWLLRYPGADHKLGEFHYTLIDEINLVGINFSDPASLDDFSADALYIPVDTDINLKIRAKDVIHSVFMPHFRVKMDAVPGMPTQFHFIATETTNEMRQKLNNPDFNFEMACAELCGAGHFAMKKLVIVLEKEEYDHWYEQQTPWLTRHPEYLARIPEKNRQLAQQIVNRNN
ncbi:MAG: cytochrome c oxidase subunit II [Candidatus Cyclobacteriaceae bacterium M3_2C_046]